MNYVKHLIESESLLSVAVAWWRENLPSNSAVRVQFPEWSGIFIFILFVCPLSVFCPASSLAVVLTFCWPQMSGARPCVPLQCLQSLPSPTGVVVVDLGFTTLLTSQVISVAFYRERETSEKFCSEALISACGSFTCRKSTTRDPRLYFPSEGSHNQDFYALKNPLTPAGFEPANLWSSGEYDNHGTTGVDSYPQN